MKIEFLTQDDPLYVLPFFEEFVRHYSDEFEILQVSAFPTMGKRSRSQLLNELRHLYGAQGLARLLAGVGASRCLGLLPRMRGAGRYYSLAQLSRTYGISCQKLGNPNEKEFIEGFRRRAPDLLISVACPFILKKELLGIAPLGAVNIHHAPLPRYKGMMPTFWQMYHGEKSVGVTIHYMVANVDEGDALYQDALLIEPRESLDHLIRRSKRHGAHCMARVLRQIQHNSATRIPLDHSKGSYFTFPTFEEIREFRLRGFRAI